MTRREILKNSFKLAILAASGGFMWKVASGSRLLAQNFLRPPGVLNEQDFLAKCIKCGLCVKVCPYDTLKLAWPCEAKIAGTPYFTPRKIPCYLCKDLPCVKICPTDALNFDSVSTNKKADISKVKAGISVIDQTNRVAFWGIQCDACYRACPFIDKALRLELKRNERTGKHAFLLPVIDPAYCVGCGKCEHACITEKAAIFVLPREVGLGNVGDNYVKGWEKGADKKLINADTNVKINRQKAIDSLNSGEF